MLARNSPLKIILTAGLIAGCLDIAAAFTQAWLVSSVPPVRVLQYIASALLGPSSFQTKLTGAAIGAGLHLLISVIIAGAWFFARKRFGMLRKNALLSAVIIGTITWVVMNLLVVPSSRVPGPGYITGAGKIITSWLILVIMLGLPIALITERMSRPFKR